MLTTIALLQIGLILYLQSDSRQAHQVGPRQKEIVEVEPSTVDLGTVSAGSVHKVQVVVRNKSTELLKFREPAVSCGCMSARLEPLSLNGGQVGSLYFELHCPESPQRFSRKVVLRTLQVPNLAWTVVVEADVVADLWMEPHSVGITCTKTGCSSAGARIGRAPGVLIDNISASNEELVIERTGETESAVGIRIMINGSSVGEGTVIAEGHLNWFQYPRSLWGRESPQTG